MICVSVSESSFEKLMGIIKSEKFVEVRLENTNFSDEELRQIFSSSLDLIATYRDVGDEDSRRMDILEKAVIFGAKYIDVELEVSDTFKEKISNIARKHGARSIISYHNFQKTPSKRELEEIVKWCYSSGADIAKIACMVQNKSDIARLLALYASDKEIISIGMGEIGKITRIIATFLGAPFTYASIDDNRKTAIGQINNRQLAKYLELLRNV